MQGQNEEYYYMLLDQLHGKTYEEQYAIILEQMKKLYRIETEYEQEHGVD
jgi:hypothetical protein